MSSDERSWDGSFDGTERWQRRQEASMSLWDKLVAAEEMERFGEMLGHRSGHAGNPAPTDRPMRQARAAERQSGYDLRRESVRLAALRRRSGLSQDALAAKLGCGKSAVSQFEHQKTLTTATLARYLRALDCELVLMARDAHGNELAVELAGEGGSL